MLIDDTYELDQVRADRVLRFVSALPLAVGQWAGRRIGETLMPWQRDWLTTLYGTIGPNGRRRYRQSSVWVGRKAAKSTTCAALALYHLVGDGEAGGEVILAAVDREQASIVYRIAMHMCRDHPGLAKQVQIFESTRRIVHTPTRSVLRVIPSDAAGAHGLNASVVIADEVHAWGGQGRELWDALVTSVGARREPLVISISTCGYDLSTLGGGLYQHACRVRDGIVEDATLLPVIFGAADGDGWDDLETWKRAHPGVGVTISEEFILSEVNRARVMPSHQSVLERLYLGRWTAQEHRWLPMASWDACAGNDSVSELEARLEGRVAYGGLDLAATTDLSAFVLAIPFEDEDGVERVALVVRVWVPDADLIARVRRDRVPYDEWARRGYVTLTSGPVVDYNRVRDDIIALQDRFDIRGISYDKWFATGIVTDLMEHGFELAPMAQSMPSLAPPTRDFLSRTLAGTLRHAGHPVLRWMADNVSVIEDSAGNMRPNKRSARGRIDGVVASIMALDQVGRFGGVGSVYNDRGLLVI